MRSARAGARGELWADLPTNFPDPAELPPALARYFGPLLREGVPVPDLPRERAADVAPAAFRALIAPEAAGR